MATLLDEYYDRHSNPPKGIAKKFLFAVFNDLFGRSGLDNAWDDIDPEIQEEVLQSNIELIKKNLIKQ